MNTKLKKSVYAVGVVVFNLAHAQEAATVPAPADAPAAAQKSAAPSVEPAAPTQQIVVTGSRIARRDAQSAAPMLTLNREDLKFAAPTSVGDIIQAMPNAGVSLNSNGTQGTAFGVSSINLRYLGSAEGSGNRTLVLVDGRRWASAAGGRGFRDFVDLNTIPLGMIDSIEILKDGASAIYGADAIAGVVNVHTRRRVDGFEANLRLGSTSRGDNESASGYLNWGKRAGKSSYLVSASFTETKPILTADRDLTRVALTPLTAPGNSPRGLYTLPGLSNNAYFGTPAGFAQNAANAITRNVGATTPGVGAAADNSFHVARLPDDYHNTMTQGIYATGPSRNLGLFARATYDVSDDTQASFEAVYSSRRSEQLFAPFLLDLRGANGYSIANNQAFNPFGTANGVPLANALGFSGSSFRLQRIPEEVGNRANGQQVDMSRVLFGLKGSFKLLGDWQYDSALSYSRNKASFTQDNQINLESVYLGMGSPATCSTAQGCVPLDMFGPLTPAMADYIRYNGRDTNGTAQTNFSFNVTRELAQLQGGPLGMAAGYEYRRESAYDRPDPFVGAESSVLPRLNGAGQAPTSAPGRAPTSGKYDLQEAYVELSMPLLSKTPWVHRLEIDAATRFSDYSTVGSKTTSKLGMLYAPVEGLMLRATVSQGFRAPSILELYQGRRQTDFQSIDPCNGGGAGLPGCAGVPATYNQNQFRGGLTPGVLAGNVNLKPESAETYAVGFSFSPSQVKGLSLTVDKFRIKVSDAIASQTATQILQFCARTAVCDLVRRGSAGEVQELTQAVVNLARIEVAGIDGTLRYTFPFRSARIDSSIDVAYLQGYKSYVPQPDGSVTVDERTGKSDQPRSTFPRYKGQASLRYIGPTITAGWKGRYIGSTLDIPNNAVNGGKVKATLYHDLQLGYNPAGSATSFAFGIDNVLDRQPPASAANNPINFDIYTYDVRGRYLYARVTTKF
ncbi:MAG: TonB-dependent receptor [Pseudomonadota bacterium]